MAFNNLALPMGSALNLIDGTLGNTITCNGLSGVYVALNPQRAYSMVCDGQDEAGVANTSLVYVFSGIPTNGYGAFINSMKMPANRAITVGPGNASLGFISNLSYVNTTITIIPNNREYGKF